MCSCRAEADRPESGLDGGLAACVPELAHGHAAVAAEKRLQVAGAVVAAFGGDVVDRNRRVLQQPLGLRQPDGDERFADGGRVLFAARTDDTNFSKDVHKGANENRLVAPPTSTKLKSARCFYGRKNDIIPVSFS